MYRLKHVFSEEPWLIA